MLDMTTSRRQVRAFLLVYYEKYRASAEQEFRSFLDELGADYELMVINNNFGTTSKCASDISGDNRNREFTGWDVGISSVEKIDAGQFYIFANDTFSEHRPWHGSYRDRFLVAFRRALPISGSVITGEIDAVWTPFSIAGKRTDRWVSTYLFGMSGDALLALGSRLSLSEDALRSMVHSVSGVKIYWGPEVDRSLQQHLERWLFPPDGRLGWYNSGQGDDRSNLGKLRCILNEKYISAAVKANGGKLINLPAGSIKMLISQSVKNVLRVFLNRK